MSKIKNALIVGGNSQDGKYLSSLLLKKITACTLFLIEIEIK